ncbi:MAG: cupin domain-containing protein [Spirochaetales bacterium]|nr:cupin domain-containing protein [Spirochaetales bacterium]
MQYRPVDLEEKFSLFEDQWSPKAVARLNDYIFKVAKVLGDFVWHKHDETDEVFLVHKGSLRIDFREGSVTLRAGQMLVVPKGVEHKPFAQELCELVLIEPQGTLNTGNVRGERTVDAVEWI